MASASPGGRLVLDLTEVSFIDSTALGTILKAAAQLDEAGTSLAVVAPEGPVRRLLEMTNLTQRFRAVRSPATRRWSRGRRRRPKRPRAAPRISRRSASSSSARRSSSLHVGRPDREPARGLADRHRLRDRRRGRSAA